ncbi:MAG: 3-methyl-2-oxobutanoate dehydrogenase subunit VorB [Caldisericia bacterium]|jgi:2-oxoglutarate ferredoxin oxidoreductase subunit alpha|nr:3-methyl-2-oxobutanoate dehydrogenase subunit VorB [Caldisericia bacterium]
MSERVFMKGAEALAEAVIRSGCRFFYGYPITPQNETPEYFARKLPLVGGLYLQAESEVAAINMVYGTACAGKRVFTSTSSPGFSLMQEGISYIACSNVPVVVANVVRGGPGLGGISPAQSDYFQATKGGGHGDYKVVVIAPSSVQEIVDLVPKAFEIADKYRTVVELLLDGVLGQMMEAVEFNYDIDPNSLPEKPWALTGAKGRKKNTIVSFNLDPEKLEQMNLELKKKYDEIEKNEKMWEEYKLIDAEYIFVAYGTVGRIIKTVVDEEREKGIKVGLFRPITLWPFPYEELRKFVDQAKFFINVEMSLGQMLEDTRLSILDRKPTFFYGRTGGVVPTTVEIKEFFEKKMKEVG